ncbi:MAG TPA: sigma-70 family RNA polymerase sigma factor [Solirubrobacteraceae bacterium]|nr:sigma-70 family RNA polymerase sigma factor [Solirubrobacteraceae bacterium]
MSPSTLRRYRAERLLRQEFGSLREEVLRSARGRLRARGVHLDGGDLEACYAQAWQGLYAAIAAGEEVANPGGWLAVVTFRRAIDEHRGARAHGLGNLAQVGPTGPERAVVRTAAGAHIAHIAHTEPDLAAELDDRAKLRQLFEALRSRLSERECEAAALCYLQGLTRAQAAQRMGISEARMTKLMEGRGPGSQGVAGKVGQLLEAISGGEWCEQQGSLMRGFAFGILDPRGERYRLARLHQRECPACRAYVLSLRGLAAVLPPLPLPWGLGFGGPHHTAPNSTSYTRTPSTRTPSPRTPSVRAPSPRTPSVRAPSPRTSSARASSLRTSSARASSPRTSSARASSPRTLSARTPPTHAGAGAKAGAGTGSGAITASGAAGAAGAGSAAGGGWLLGGSVGAKLAVGCVLALSVGCVALTVAPRHAGASHREGPRRRASPTDTYLADAPGALAGSATLAEATRLGAAALTGATAKHSSATAPGSSPIARAAAVRRAADRHAQGEFGLEQPASAAAPASSSASAPATARAASVQPAGTSAAEESTASSAATPAPTPSGPPSHAEREFGPE